jgi:hypothetical protein
LLAGRENPIPDLSSVAPNAYPFTKMGQSSSADHCRKSSEHAPHQEDMVEGKICSATLKYSYVSTPALGENYMSCIQRGARNRISRTRSESKVLLIDII